MLVKDECLAICGHLHAKNSSAKITHLNVLVNSFRYLFYDFFSLKIKSLCKAILNLKYKLPRPVRRPFTT